MTTPAADAIAELRGRLETAGLHVRWDMTPEQQTAMDSLVTAVGAEPLVEVALELSERLGTPRYARSWLGAWRRDARIVAPDPRPP